MRRCRGLIDQPAGEVAVGIDAAVTQEGPVGARHIDGAEVDFLHENLLLSADALAMISPEVLAMKLWPQNSMPSPPTGCLVPDAVGHRHIAAVGHRVGALDRLPRGVVGVAVAGPSPPGCQPMAVG